MKIEKSFKRAIPGLAAAAALAMGLPAANAADAAGAGDFKFGLSGYARAWVSINLENQGEFKPNNGLHNGVGCAPGATTGGTGGGGACSGPYGAGFLNPNDPNYLSGVPGTPNAARPADPLKPNNIGYTATDYSSKYKPSMVRGSILLDGDASYMGLKFKAIARLDREYKTDYLEELEDLRKANLSGNNTSPFGYNGGGSTANPNSIMDNYNNFDFREFWVEAPIGDRTTVKIGRQQIVWGESDFFHAMDVVHGYDLSWRLFFEGENEEWRKPLILISTKIRIPEADGMLAAYIRPGWDRCSDIGNTYDVNGGRWFFNPYRGYTLETTTTKDCGQENWDEKNIGGGIRWQGEAFDLSYSIAYLHANSADPVANTNPNVNQIGVVGATGYKGSTVNGSIFDRIHPEIDVIGVTLSGYSAMMDAVVSTEIAYTFNQPFNQGQGGFFGYSGDPAAPGAGAVPCPENSAGFGGAAGVGLCGIKTKGVINSMLRFDKNLKLEDVLGTTRPSFSSIQLFDQWVMDWKDSDQLVRLFAYGSPLKEHNTILTAFTVLNYMNDKINPSFVVGFDINNGGGFAIPAVAFTLNDNWVGKVEADIFWSGGSSRTNDAQFSNERSQLFGYFDKATQLVFRLTRQF
jgi:hypothetical protein